MLVHIVDDEQRSDRRATPMRPSGSGSGGICGVGAPRRCTVTSPASRRLASAPAAPGTRPLLILGQAPRSEPDRCRQTGRIGEIPGPVTVGDHEMVFCRTPEQCVDKTLRRRLYPNRGHTPPDSRRRGNHFPDPTNKLMRLSTGRTSPVIVTVPGGNGNPARATAPVLFSGQERSLQGRFFSQRHY
jgi:hypothetical protein